MKRIAGSSPGLSFLRVHSAASFSVLYFLLLLPFLAKNRLFGLDESIYANAALSAVRDGHWLSFRFMGEPFFEKPPLGLWIQSLCLWLFGHSEWSVRLPSAAAGAGVLYFTWKLAARLGRSETVGFFAAALLGTSEHFLLFARVANLDMMLLLCLLGGWWELLNAFDPTKEHAAPERLKSGKSASSHFYLLSSIFRSALGKAGLWLAAGLLIKSFFAFVYLIPAVLALAWSRKRSVPWRTVLVRAGVPVALAFTAWFILYGAIFGRPFLDWELGSNLAFRVVTGAVGRIFRKADVDFHSWQLYAELAKNGFAFLWPLLPMGFLAWMKEAHTGIRHRRSDFLVLGGFVILVFYLFLSFVVLRPLINYLLPLAPFLVLALAALWRKSPCLKHSLLLSAVALLAFLNGFTRHAFVDGKFLLAGLAAFIAWNLPDTKPHHGGRRLRLLAVILLLAGSAVKAVPYLVRPPDPNAEWVQAVKEHPAREKGETLLFYGTPTDARAVQFYCDYRVVWTDQAPPQRPKEAMLFEYNDTVHFLPAMDGN